MSFDGIIVYHLTADVLQFLLLVLKTPRTEFWMVSYDKKLSIKEEILFFNKADLLNEGEIREKLSKFKKKIKSKYEVISIYSNKDIEKIKKLLIKYAS